MPDLSLFDLSGRAALVTGGASGIGRAAALALAAAGADVAIVDLQEDVGEKTAASIQEMGRNSTFVRADVSRADQVDAIVESVVRRFGRLDIAVNSAGMYSEGDDETQSLDDWSQVIGLNLTGVWLCCRAEMRQMAKQTPTEGKIIIVASIAAGHIVSNGSYDASKAAVVQLTKTLAVQWGRYNININSISPGYVGKAFGITRPPEERQRLRGLTPLGHVQRAEDLCGAFVFLASPASNYITGQNLVVDGGHTLDTWLYGSLSREVPPRIDPSEEVGEMTQDVEA